MRVHVTIAAFPGPLAGVAAIVVFPYAVAWWLLRILAGLSMLTIAYGLGVCEMVARMAARWEGARMERKQQDEKQQAAQPPAAPRHASGVIKTGSRVWERPRGRHRKEVNPGE